MARLGEASPRDHLPRVEVDHHRKEPTHLKALGNIRQEDRTEIKIRLRTRVRVLVTSTTRIMIQERVVLRVIPEHNLPERRCQTSICWSKTAKV
jgi:hypothetical protein